MQFILIAFTALISPVSWDYNLIWASLGFYLLIKISHESIIKTEASLSRKIKFQTHAIFYAWIVLLLPIPWNLTGSTEKNVSIADLFYFPMIIWVIWSWKPMKNGRLANSTMVFSKISKPKFLWFTLLESLATIQGQVNWF